MLEDDRKRGEANGRRELDAGGTGAIEAAKSVAARGGSAEVGRAALVEEAVQTCEISPADSLHHLPSSKKGLQQAIQSALYSFVSLSNVRQPLHTAWRAFCRAERDARSTLKCNARCTRLHPTRTSESEL